MATIMASMAVAGASPAQAPAPDPAPALARIEGDWDGSLDTGAMKLRLALHIHVKDGATVATLDSLDQGAKDMPATVTLEGDHVQVSAKGAAGGFDGALAADGASLSGHWGAAPVTFTRRTAGAAAPALNRPQIPVKPYPYDETAISFDSPSAHVRMGGTLTMPRGAGPFPAVALVAGSGPQLRDEAVLGHPIFLVLADYLTRHGIAVLRYDKRGLGQSGGDYAHATSADFAADAEAALAYLRSQPNIDERRIGLIGHSEGGIVAPMVALADPGVAFVVMMAGPGLPGDRIIEAQARRIGQAMGVPAAALAANEAIQRKFLDAVMTAKDGPSAEAAAREVLKQAGAPDATAEAQAKAASSDWYRFFLSHDPAPDLRRLRLPVLALVGSKDLQVPADENVPALRQALAADPQATVEELPGLNHLFQTAVTGAPSEYGTIEETIAPAALDRIAAWILAQRPRR